MTNNILMIKTSSLGDILQAFAVLPYLTNKVPSASIDWLVEERFADIVRAHPLVARTISFKSKWPMLARLRRESYDIVFDLQGNCKSGLLTLFSKSSQKVGFGRKSVREWPNLFTTHLRYDVSAELNIRHQYVQLVQQYFEDLSPIKGGEGIRFKIGEEERESLNGLLFPGEMKIMVCPGSRWANKQLSVQTLIAFLLKVKEKFSCVFLLMWGCQKEKEMCEEIHRYLSRESRVIDPLPIPLWQNLMCEMDYVIAVDSAALHLCGTTATPSFSIFGPTMPAIFKPLGPLHSSLQGACPYGQKFQKQCPRLRNCPTGACVKNLASEELFRSFYTFMAESSSLGQRVVNVEGRVRSRLPLRDNSLSSGQS
jgi:heptosyltransferase-1